MTNRIKILSLVFLVLIVMVVFSLREEVSETEKATYEIALTDTSSVNKITFRPPFGSTVTLTRQTNGSWVLNDKYEARNYLITLILAGLNKAQVKREVSDNVVSKITKDLKEKGYLVTLLSSQGKKIREFYVLGNESDPNSSFYLPTDAKTPLVIFVPGFEGSIANVFALPVGEWRSKDFFRSNERTLQKVSVQYPQFPKENFTINYSKGGFSVEGVENTDTTRLYSYLQNYQYLTIYQYLTDQKSNILQMLNGKAPLAILSVESLSESKTMEIFEDKGKMIGIIKGSGEIVSLRTDLYGRLLVKKSFFRKQND